MERIITYENLRNFTYSNDKLCGNGIRGIALEFRGLGFNEMRWEDPEISSWLADRGIALLMPYYNPWCWMNGQAVAYTDEIIDVLVEHYGLPEDIPIVSTGGSMGGLSSLVYTAYAKRTPVACISNCPVCDLPYHYTERPDLPRTLYSAFWHETGTLEEAMERHSPVHLVDRMPDVQYHIFHCELDAAVSKEKHSDVFVGAMKRDHRVEYYPVPERGHCDLSPEQKAFFWQLVVDEIEKHAK